MDLGASLKWFGLLVSLGTLAGCGGGGGDTMMATGGAGGARGVGGGPQPLPTAPPVTVVQTAQAYPAEAGGVDMIGVQLNTDLVLARAQLAETTGVVNISTGVLKMNDGTNFFEDSNGTRTNTLLLEDAGSVRLIFDFGTRYASTDGYTGSDQSGSGDVTGVIFGVMGDTANAGQFGAGTATYTGDAIGRWDSSTSTDSFDFNSGRSTVTADFGSNSASVVMGNFTQQGNAPFDQIRISGMTINGNRFNGGQVQARLNGSVVNVVGPNGQDASAGIFAGVVSGGTPAEAAGIAYVRGDDASFFGAFVGN